MADAASPESANRRRNAAMERATSEPVNTAAVVVPHAGAAGPHDGLGGTCATSCAVGSRLTADPPRRLELESILPERLATPMDIPNPVEGRGYRSVTRARKASSALPCTVGGRVDVSLECITLFCDASARRAVQLARLARAFVALTQCRSLSVPAGPRSLPITREIATRGSRVPSTPPPTVRGGGSSSIRPRAISPGRSTGASGPGSRGATAAGRRRAP